MAMSITLYKNCRYNVSDSMNSMSSTSLSYLNGLSKITKSVSTVALGQPIPLKYSIADLIPYNYGYIDYGDGQKYYFEVIDLEFVTEGITNIHYTIDVFASTITSSNYHWTFGQCRVRRIGESRIPSENVIINIDTTITRTTKYSDVNWYAQCLFVLTKDVNDNLTSLFLPYSEYGRSLLDGTWIEQIDPAFTPPANTIVTALLPTYNNELTTKTYDGLTYYYHLGAINPFDYSSFAIGRTTLTNNGITWDIIKDYRGNIVFTCPYGKTLTYIESSIDANASMVVWHIFYRDSTNNLYIVTVPLEGVDVYIDAWDQYRVTERGIDMETRNLQNNQNAVNSIVNIGQSAIGGAIAGSAVPGVGTAIGAIGGGVVGLVSSSIGVVSGYTSAPKEQNLIDRRYMYANDTLLQIGNAYQFMFSSGYCPAGIYRVTVPDGIIDSYELDVEQNGAYCDFIPDDPYSYLDEGPLTADVTINGGLPSVWREQLISRFANGVKIS